MMGGSTRLETVFSVAAILLQAACSECGKDSDCPSGERCVQGSCVPVSGPIDTSTDTESDTDLDGQDPDVLPDTVLDPPADTVGDDVPVDPGDVEADALVPCDTDAQCDDGNVCTTDVCHLEGRVCYYTFNNGYLCDDGEFCNGIEICEMGSCAAGAAVVCTDPNPCVEGHCDEVTEACAWSRIDDHTTCDNGYFCDGTDECIEGTCTPLYDVTCNDSSPCTQDSCDWDANACAHVPVAVGTDWISCGETTLALMTGVDDRVSSYDCDGTSYPGHTAETIYEVAIPTASDLVVTIGADPEDPTVFQTFLLTDKCDPASCVAAGDKTLSLAGVSGTVYIVVERDTVGASWLTVECL